MDEKDGWMDGRRKMGATWQVSMQRGGGGGRERLPRGHIIDWGVAALFPRGIATGRKLLEERYHLPPPPPPSSFHRPVTHLNALLPGGSLRVIYTYTPIPFAHLITGTANYGPTV